MAIDFFDEDTFVAYSDISGFKQLMVHNDRALDALNLFYNSGYSILQRSDTNIKVEGFFISDCCVLFVRGNGEPTEKLNELLRVLRQLNRRMIENDYMLTTSIAYGQFKYHQRIEFEGIGKMPIYGNAYVSAFLDAENGTPKIQPGECRIVKRNLPDNVQIDDIDLLRKKGEHYYYYWMINENNEIDDFEKRYKDSYNLKFTGMIKALKGDR